MTKRLISTLALCIFGLFIAGCGGGTSGAPVISKGEAALGCIDCHRSMSSEWQLSTHNTKNGAACADCHDTHPGHPNTCNTCHNGQTSSNPAYIPLRNDGPVSGYSDVSSSNMCLACHVGTISGNSLLSARFGNFSAMSFINSRLLPGGTTIFKKTGFNFYTSPLKYADKNFYLHSQIGVSNNNSTGVLGPCMTCHVGQASETKRHIPIPMDRSGNLLSTVCNKCHTTVNFLPIMSTTALKSEKDGYEASLALLAKVLKDRGFAYVDTYPNFTNTNWKTDYGTYGGFGNAIVPRTGGLTAAVFTMGAAFNFNLLWHDYGAYAHNRYYAKRLIFDSIDWVINGGALRGTIETKLNTLPATPATPGELLFTRADGVTKVYYNDTVRANAIQYLQGGPGGIRP